MSRGTTSISVGKSESPQEIKRQLDESLKSPEKAGALLRSWIPTNWKTEKKSAVTSLVNYLVNGCGKSQDGDTPLYLDELVEKLTPVVKTAVEKATSQTPAKTYAGVVKTVNKPHPSTSDFEVVISIMKVADDHLFHKGSPQEIQEEVTKALRSLDGHFKPDFVLHNVHILKGNMIILHAATVKDVKKICCLHESSVSHFGVQLTVSECTFQVTVHGVPVNLIDPSGQATTSVFFHENQAFIHNPQDVKSIYYLQGNAQT